jgi:hypothetical protein
MEALYDFKTLKITKTQLQNIVGKNLHKVKVESPIVISNKDVIFILESFNNGEISLATLIDWVNVVWFTELYDYADEYQVSIASVMSELEELDEDGNEITFDKIALYIETLKNNREL